MLRCLTVLIVLFSPLAAGAQGLTVTECTDIQRLYNTMPDECVQLLGSQTSGTAPARAGKPAAPSPGGDTAGPTGALRENHIFFSGGGTTLDATALAQIDQLARVLQVSVMRNACLQLIGHSDSSGGAAANKKIAMARAETVRDALQSRLPGPPRVDHVLSMGEHAPLSAYSDTSTWQRRVEIRARTCPPA